MKRRSIVRQIEMMSDREVPHIFVPSYMRPNFASAQRIFSTFSEESLKRVHIVVRPEQADAYRKANPSLDIIPIADDVEVNGLASTRQFIFDEAVRRRYKIIIDMDDDITLLGFLYSGVNGRGEPCSRHSVKADLQEIEYMYEKILTLAATIADEAFKEDPRLVFGNIHRQRMSMHPDLNATKLMINSGPTPRQVTIVNVRRLHQMGINRSMRFERHGDDIGYCAEILKNGGHLFNIPCLIYDYVSEKCDSVCRTPETEKELHALEYRMLQKYPIKDYLRTTFKDEDGNYMWGDIDWRKYHKLHGTSSVKIPWH